MQVGDGWVQKIWRYAVYGLAFVGVIALIFSAFAVTYKEPLKPRHKVDARAGPFTADSKDPFEADRAIFFSQVPELAPHKNGVRYHFQPFAPYAQAGALWADDAGGPATCIAVFIGFTDKMIAGRRVQELHIVKGKVPEKIYAEAMAGVASALRRAYPDVMGLDGISVDFEKYDNGAVVHGSGSTADYDFYQAFHARMDYLVTEYCPMGVGRDLVRPFETKLSAASEAALSSMPTETPKPAVSP